MRKSLFLTLTTGIIFGIFLLASLGLKCNVQGTRPNNVEPIISIANIPPANTVFSSRPIIHWFGKDIDGYVAEYQYVVFKASQITLLANTFGQPFIDSSGNILPAWLNYLKSVPGPEWMDSLTKVGEKLDTLGEEIVLPVKLVTDVGAGQTSDEVRLFAAADPADTILQYFFVRAMDNAGAVSNTAYRRFSRTNNPPNSKIIFDTLEVNYSLDNFTETWKGIPISWGGTDSIDYPVGDPPLEFFWQFFFLGGPDPSDTAGPGVLISSSDEWVADKAGLLPTGLQTGFYKFTVQARDDAFIVDQTPAQSVFYIIRPTFQKAVLIADITSFFINARGVVTDPTKYRSYYLDLFDSAGFPVDTMWSSGSGTTAPTERLLSQYQLVFVLNHDNALGISSNVGRQLIKYLNVGGKVWISGITNFTTGATFDPGSRRLRAFSSELSAALGAGEQGYNVELGSKYCGLEAYFMPLWNASDDSIGCNAAPCEDNHATWPAYPVGRNEEFMSALPAGLSPISGLPTVELDSINVGKASVLTGDSRQIYKDKLPHVNYSTLYSIHPNFTGDPARAIYQFNSSYGISSDQMNGKPCASVYQGPTFQTAVFTFPLFYCKFDQTLDMTKKLLAWFGVN